ncbi:hypothetical protein RND71_000766 [Anisodus tanguticus]|uniref:TCTP domain-containing protein n=1 Tax=Anisodus tanguticus TaxID=243964 RepID=A0AAE1SZL0_9SOLA|nr:hypothetical protein RND71_000766 [Anisodus tanguticus]
MKVKVLMIKLSRLSILLTLLDCRFEQPAFDKKQFVAYMKKYIKTLTSKLEGEPLETFKKNIEPATKFLLTKLKDLQFFVGESMHDDGSLVFAYYKDGATDPTFLYLAPGLKEVKC